MEIRHLPLLLFCMFFLISCKGADPKQIKNGSCINCHTMELDHNHDIGCSRCHAGDKNKTTQETAHIGLIKEPAHPDSMAQACGPCHEQIIKQIPTTSHFTLAKMTNEFRGAFGASQHLDSFRETPVTDAPADSLELADDLLRKRCFRCHPYSKGDDYPAVRRGSGCAACHLSFNGGHLTSHIFHKPTDSQCLSCHYGNYVGFDYYGRFERDFADEYKTPFSTDKTGPAYGVPFHRLQPDIHQQAGMICTDCHSGSEIMSDAPAPSCEGCHLSGQIETSSPPGLSRDGAGYHFTAKNGQQLILPLATNPVHIQYKKIATCQACHAQWSFVDRPTHLLRSDTDEYSQWSSLTSQGDSSLERLLLHNLDFYKDELPPATQDRITGDMRSGIWLKGFTARRWGSVLLGRDSSNRLAPVRPSLDYRLSWIDADEKVHFDNVAPLPTILRWRSYVPHTTGPAGLFWQERFLNCIAEPVAGDKPSAQAKQK